MSAQRPRCGVRCGALALAACLVAAAGARAQNAEPIALEVEFAQGVDPCFTSAELAGMVSERLGQSVSGAPGQAPPLAIHVRIDRATDSGFSVAIDSRERDTGVTGQRELDVAGDCTALAQPVSLVVALMVGSAVSEPAPAPAAAPAPAPPPAPPQPVAAPTPPPAPTRPLAARPAAPPVKPAQPPRPAPPVYHPRPEFALRASGGADLGMNGKDSPLASFAVEYTLLDPTPQGRAGLAGEVGAELVTSPTIHNDGYEMSANATGLQTALCGVFVYGRLAVDACAGLWTRALSLSGDGDDEAALESRLVTLVGWSVRFSLRVEVAPHWALFAAAQGLTLFGMPTLTLKALPTSPEVMETPPFFNSEGLQQDPTWRVQVYEPPVSAAVLLAGVTFAP